MGRMPENFLKNYKLSAFMSPSLCRITHKASRKRSRQSIRMPAFRRTIAIR
jgi:hypothetical protein